MWQLAGFIVFVVAVLLLMRGSFRRFVRRQQDLGRWDEYGPLVETEAPPSGRGEMNERLEVIGKWKGKVLRRRMPHEKP